MDNDKTYMVLYHKEDNDGVFSAAIFIDFLITTQRVHPNQIIRVGCDHNSLNKYTDEDIKKWWKSVNHVIMLDISFSDWKKMALLRQLFGINFTWVDHHAPILRESIIHNFDDVNGIRDVHASTIVNLYNYLYNPLSDPNIKVPIFLEYLSKWDSWTFDPEEKNFIYYFNTGVTNRYKLNVDDIIPIANRLRDHFYDSSWMNSILELVEFGKNIVESDRFRWKQLLENYGEEWTVGPNNRRAIAVYVQGPSSSLCFDSVKHRYDNGIVFKHNPDGTWSFSLYNTKEDSSFHCGTYLRSEFKGGGHEGAAGAQITNRKYNSMYKTKHM